MKLLGSEKIVCIGGGNMAKALVGGWLARGLQAEQLLVAEPSAEGRASLIQAFQIRCFENNLDAAQQADVWVLATKPQVMPQVCEQLRAIADQRAPLVISIAAGIRSNSLQSWLGNKARIVRAMPNTPALLGHGATGVYASASVPPQERSLVMQLLAAVGSVCEILDENLMDAVTATSGSGPAYFFLLIEAMQLAAEKLGLPAETAKQLVLQTAKGAAEMAAQSDVSASVLRERVTSPGGTTQAALEVFDSGQFRELVDAALKAATARGRALSDQFGN